MSRRIITLLTDFGMVDSYVAQMKGVLASLAPEASVVDLSHEISPQAIRQAALFLKETAFRFPAGSIHICVVDPGVGSGRDIVVAKANEQWFVLPDNGLLTYVCREASEVLVHRVDNQSLFLKPVSRTFHGRDIMSPIAAFLAGGGDVREVGPERSDWVKLDDPYFELSPSGFSAEIIRIDHFGNIVLASRGLGSDRPMEGRSYTVTLGDRLVQAVGVLTYANATCGEFVMLVGSSGDWEIAIPNRSAAEQLQAKVGEIVNISSK